MILEFVVEVKQRGEDVEKNILRKDDLKANVCSRKSLVRRECEKDEARISGPGQVMLRSLTLVYRSKIPKLLKLRTISPPFKELFVNQLYEGEVFIHIEQIKLQSPKTYEIHTFTPET